MGDGKPFSQSFESLGTCFFLTCSFLQFILLFFFCVSAITSLKRHALFDCCWLTVSFPHYFLTHCWTSCRDINFPLLIASTNKVQVTLSFSRFIFWMHQLTVDCCFVCFLLPSWCAFFPATCLCSMPQSFFVFAHWLLCPMALLNEYHSSLFSTCTIFLFPLCCCTEFFKCCFLCTQSLIVVALCI